MNTMMYRVLLTLLGTLLLGTGCNTQKDYSVDIAAIYDVLQVRRQAVANKDLALYDSIIFSDYSDAGIKRELVLEDIKMTFNRLPGLNLQQPRIRPDVKRNSARVLQSSIYQIGAGEQTANIRETLMFRKIEGKWYISAGIALRVASKMK